MFESEALRLEIYEQFASWEEEQLDVAEAIEFGKQERKRQGSRRRAHESAVRLGKITGKRKAEAAAKAVLPLLAALAPLQTRSSPELRGAAKRIRLRRDGEVIRTVEVAR